MEASELLKKVRQIEIKTRGLSRNIFAGEYHTAFKGKGMTFSEVREYQYGDDVRDIDWNVTARFNKPFVKVFEEEREAHEQVAAREAAELEAARAERNVVALEAIASGQTAESTAAMNALLNGEE